MSESQERRNEWRLDKGAAIFIELPEQPPEPVHVVLCEAIDFSANGLQLKLDRELTAGAILRVGVQVPHYKPCYLVGQVKWSRLENGDWLAGLLLYESEQTDIAFWKEQIARLLN